jgi:hypothetical protein
MTKNQVIGAIEKLAKEHGIKFIRDEKQKGESKKKPKKDKK